TWRLWLSAGAAVAAGIALTWMLFGQHFLHKSAPQPNQIVENSFEPPMLRTATWSGMMDDGTEVVDNQPMRRMKRKVVEQVEWYDPKDRAMVRTTMPKQEIYLIGLETNAGSTRHDGPTRKRVWEHEVREVSVRAGSE